MTLNNVWLKRSKRKMKKSGIWRRRIVIRGKKLKISELNVTYTWSQGFTERPPAVEQARWSKLSVDPWWKQYRLIGRENRDQKKEIELLKTRLNLVAAERSAEMGFRNDSEMLPPPLIPINTIKPHSPSLGDGNASKRPQRRCLANASTSNGRTRSNDQSKMSHVLQKPRPWKCTLCSGYFPTIENLRQHVYGYHTNRKYFCARCPFSCDGPNKIEEHEQDRDQNSIMVDLRLDSKENFRFF